MKKFNRTFIYLIIVAVIALCFWWYPKMKTTPSDVKVQESSIDSSQVSGINTHEHKEQEQVSNAEETKESTKSDDVSVLSAEKTVVKFIKDNHKLPAFYIKKGDARAKGWNPVSGNLCKVLPGRVIGGDNFSNREHKLPILKGRQWFEADINYSCNRRGTDRLLFSSDHLIYVSYDHYETFQQR